MGRGTMVRSLGWSVGLVTLLVAATLSYASPAEAQEVGTEAASGCNIDVCIFLDGSGLTVTKWRTTGTVSGYKCGYAYFWRNGSVIRSIYACGDGTVSATWNSPGTFSHGDELCNTWTVASGKPCATIYA